MNMRYHKRILNRRNGYLLYVKRMEKIFNTFNSYMNDLKRSFFLHEILSVENEISNIRTQFDEFQTRFDEHLKSGFKRGELCMFTAFPGQNKNMLGQFPTRVYLETAPPTT